MARFWNRVPTSGTMSQDGGWVLPTLDGLMLIGVGLAGIGVVWSLIDMLASSTVSDLSIGLATVQLADGLPEGVVLDEAQGLVTVTVGVGYRMAWWLTGPGAGVLALLGFVWLRRIVTTARAGDPFMASNVNRIRALALLAFTYFLLIVARSSVAVAIQADLNVGNPTATLSLMPVVLAVVLLALSEIWRRGVELREEQQFTV